MESSNVPYNNLVGKMELSSSIAVPGGYEVRLLDNTFKNCQPLKVEEVKLFVSSHGDIEERNRKAVRLADVAVCVD
jgi:hypothetical protein